MTSVKQSHVLVVPSPAQGHVTPLVKLAHQIVDHGIKVTFVNIESAHKKFVTALRDTYVERQGMRFAPIPDGLGSKDPQRDVLEVHEIIQNVPHPFKEFIEKINGLEEDVKVDFVIADLSANWALEVAAEMGIKRAGVCVTGPASLALALQIPKLIEDGIIDIHGISLKDKSICLSDNIPIWHSDEFMWSFPSNPTTQKICFEHASRISQTTKLCDWILCNTCYETDPSACDLVPNILTIGPLLASNDHSHSSGSMRLEDSTCISWLDNQPAGSVVYVAFGSAVVLSHEQFEELEHCLASLGKPFLWVVPWKIANESVSKSGKVVQWAPQEKVLAHPSTACFVSHCGWNSTLEGLSNGVPFLCWPNFVDQFHNQKYICDVWKIGLRLDSDKSGVFSWCEIKGKIEKLLTDDGIKGNTLKFKEIVRGSLANHGSSSRNLEYFIEHLKAD
ncbi:UDP-glucuronosyl/UDP-glucosyltransferase [Dillenia turbinata]|uniref:UDP-glucuronosyl/UDP-glucosyltransferase n=1 Tax=Dillenia turbinata TaxID=194707 RepID=A0AAN8YZK1_9MAGN